MHTLNILAKSFVTATTVAHAAVRRRCGNAAEWQPHIAWVAAVTAAGADAGAGKGAKHAKSIICLCNCLNTLSQ